MRWQYRSAARPGEAPLKGPSQRGRGGFTLIEVAVATAIIGIGVTALLSTVAAGTRANGAGRTLTQATFIAQELREWTLRLPFKDPDPADATKPPGNDGSDPQTFVDDLDDLMNVTYSPPRDGRGQPMTDLVGWEQRITLTWRNPSNIAQTVANGGSDLIYVHVAVRYRNQEVLTTGWLVSKR